MNLAIALEDYRHDQYIVKAILKGIEKQIDKSIKYVIIMDPMISGIEDLRKKSTVEKICNKYGPMVDLIIFIHDRDGRSDRDSVCSGILKSADSWSSKVRCFSAHQEIETWGLAGMSDLPKEWSWQEIREEGSVKEVYFNPYIESKQLQSTAGKGRAGMAKKISYKRVVSRCPEVKSLELEIANYGA